ncbi:GTP-binding protein gtr2 [Kluyveromyces marxianus]|uniref:GTP-binding protein n=2 Tax=Kluyveromyces marxianus TaxID=4911 RepID=W0TBN6_KLUMD|nr:GTP-binding protein GTR2 [Kluyveromyces marxianus DMKU3-1042]KAG0669015.1 GTP-binding protein gtr2 [Kluyveromyces marxianus]KAG0678373.1 GTP-binding protein gtr2 [Kluyveromyces marxianus]QGN16522.1 GTP-binding protein GTR2 [Kluyveromyces marxianus]BAO40795.1 GTP-binding protein GTR2 [Kluyveromyces marxianus DMKU3-1042]BAP72265.1 GTP-binding protein GTR2 [Kluyveromyces marxianus]
MDTNSVDASKATILLMGLRRGGKSSICKVVFHNMQPLDTLYLESTTSPTQEHFSTLIDLAVMELPGQLNYFEPSYESEQLFKSVGALVYVIDSQDEYLNALTNLAMIIEYAKNVNPYLNVEVLIHKVDGLTEDFKMDIQRDIMQRIGDELLDLGIEGIQLSFYLTSIFDHSIYEAFSRIVQKLIPELPFLENMLDNLVQHSKLEKCFLLDINSKIYVSTDSSPVDIQTYEVCAEFVDVTIDLQDLYKGKLQSADNKKGNEMKSVSVLNNGVIIYLKQMIRGLALVTLMRPDDTDIESRLTVMDYNVDIFKKGLEKIWEKSKLITDSDDNTKNIHSGNQVTVSNASATY